MSDDFDPWERVAYFDGEDCVCDHDDEAHGWGKCEVNECPCLAAWSE